MHLGNIRAFQNLISWIQNHFIKASIWMEKRQSNHHR